MVRYRVKNIPDAEKAITQIIHWFLNISEKELSHNEALMFEHCKLWTIG